MEFCKENSVHSEFIICLLKQFVLKNKESAKTLFNFLSFVVCLSTSEAIVESWGLSIFKLKPNRKEWLELENTATVDKLVFIRLSGPYPGLSLELTKVHWLWCLNASHFLHIGSNLKAISIVVDRMLSSNEALPCFLN